MAAGVTGCGSSASDSTTDQPPTDHAALNFGSRGIPEGVVTVTAPTGKGVSVTTFRLTVTETKQFPTQVSARIGNGYDENATLRDAIQITPGIFELDFPTANIVTGAHVWVRATYANGSVCETGADDFGL